MSASIEATGVGVRFLFDRQQRGVTPMLARLRRRGGESWGLVDVDLSVGPGESVALLGPSGSGKTTLLRVIAGIVYPDAGTLTVEGTIGSLLSIDAGLLSTLTGRENAMLLGVLGGLSRAEARRNMAAVLAGSELEEAFDRPVSSFSQGMRARLGLTVADQSHPEILLLDEVHEALDHRYRAVITERAHAMLEDGGIVVAAGHDHPLLEQFCDRALWLRKGRVAGDGPFADIRDAYLASQ
jgi:ABC-type polysaccharide/polyol phosphate transport system ATPase subunit